MYGVFVALLPAIVLLVVLIPVLAARLRTSSELHSAARQWAAVNHCAYMQLNPAMTAYLSGHPFIGGQGANVADFIEGKTPKGRAFCSFIYSYGESTGNSSTAAPITATVIRLPAMLPQLTVTRESISDKFAHFLGGQDIELESDDFNQMYRVQSSNEAFAYGVLTPKIMQWLIGPAAGLAPFMINGQDLICWRSGYPNYMMLGAQLTAMEAFVDEIPQGVYEQFAMQPPRKIWWTPRITTRPGPLQYRLVPVPRR